MHEAQDHLGLDDEIFCDDEESRSDCGSAERQISQRDFWEGGLMNVHLEHVQDDIFEIKARVLEKFCEI